MSELPGDSVEELTPRIPPRPIWRDPLALVALLIVAATIWWGVVERKDDGHRRMLALLADLKERTVGEDPYLGDGGLTEMQSRLAATSPATPAVERFELSWAVAHHHLRLGRNESATKHFATVMDLLPVVRERLEDVKYHDVLFQVAVAWMRRGETENCVHCQTPESCLLPIRGGGVHEHPESARQAITVLEQLLEANPDHLAGRWLLNIAWMAVGEYPGGVPEQFRIPPQRLESDETFPRFVNVSSRLGLDAVNLSGGAVADDFDNDGWLDIATSTWDTAGTLRLYHNNGDGTWTERTRDAGLEGIFGGLNLVQADYDNDGDVDLLVLRGGWLEQAGRRHPNSLLSNDGQGHFEDVTFASGLGQTHYPTQTAAWADYDNDGDLDLVIGNEGFPVQLFRNDGRGHFRDVARSAGIARSADDDEIIKGVAWGDIDNDNDVDLFLSVRGGDNRLFRNNADGTFSDIAAEAGVTRPSMSFPVWFWDFNNDGALDLFVSSYREGVEHVAADYFGQSGDSEPDCLYRGNGAGVFREVAAAQGLIRVTQPMGCNHADIDNDGWPDFYLGTGYPEYAGVMPNLLFRNRGGTGFADVTTAAGFGHLQKGHAVAFADFDHDGDLDVFQQIGGWYPGDAYANALFENPGFQHHWLAVRLEGRRSNRSAIGARIRVEFTEGDTSRVVYQWIGSGGSFGCNPLRAHIGLGSATRVDQLEVYWPTTGRSERFSGIEVDRLVELVEGTGTLKQRVLRPAPFQVDTETDSRVER